MKKKVVNVLSIDGGGIRGILPSQILVYVEKKLSEIYGKTTRLSDHFDLIAGTSTGGILAALYCFPDKDGNPKYTAEESLNLYMNNGSDIFKKQSRWYYTLNGLLGPRYNPDNIENLFEMYFEDTRIKESTTNLMLSSIDNINREIYFFKSYKAKEKEPHNTLFKDAVRATSAAPTYFRPNHIYIDGEERSLIDGGLGINNPTISAYIEIGNLYPEATTINILSIGTSPLEESISYKVAKKWGTITGAPKLFDITLASMADAVDYQMSELYKNENMIGNYLRVQPQLFNASGEMDDASHKNLKALQEAGIKSTELNKAEIDIFLEKTSM